MVRVLSHTKELLSRDSVVGIARFRVLIPVGADVFCRLQSVQTGYGAHVGGWSGWGAGLSIHFHLVSSLRVSGAIPLFLLYAFVASTRKTLPFLSGELLASVQGH